MNKKNVNRFFTLLLAATCLTAVGQVTYPYNPDGNADGQIAVGDLQDFLLVYGNPFSPAEVQIDGTDLEDYIEQLTDSLLALAAGGNTCYAVQGSFNGVSFTPVPSNCRHVNVYTGYGSGAANPLRLPEQGLFVGHTISFFLLPYGNANRTVGIEPYPEDNISDEATLIPCNGSYCGGALSYNTSVAGNSNHNKKFVWDGLRWVLVSSGAITIN